MDRATIFKKIGAERERQDFLHGDSNKTNSDLQWLSILEEEKGEACKELNEITLNGKEDRKDMEKELIEAAAVIVAWLENR